MPQAKARRASRNGGPRSPDAIKKGLLANAADPFASTTSSSQQTIVEDRKTRASDDSQVVTELAVVSEAHCLTRTGEVWDQFSRILIEPYAICGCSITVSVQYEHSSSLAMTSKPSDAASLCQTTIGAPKESFPNERRVAITPDSAKLLIKKGFNVCIESDAGAAANLPDESYEEVGVKIVSRNDAFLCDVVFKCRAPTDEEVDLFKPGGVLISFVHPAQNENLLNSLAAKRVTVFGMDCIPRITRAQTFDALSSMANIAGYKAIVEAAHHFGRFLSGQMTAAGRIPPAKVLVIGGGVAGLSAIATAKNMGAVVRCFDTRPAVKEQVESLGGEFLEVKGLKLEEGTGGYAKEMTKEFIEAEMALFAAQAQEVDIIVTTALIPGRPAPRLITKEMVQSMKFGSVVVDLAAEMGGNVETTRKDELYTSPNGVLHIGYTDLPSRLPNQSSKLYGNNVAKFFLSIADTNVLTVNLKDDVTRGSIILLKGNKLWPPPRAALPPPPAPRPKVVSIANARDCDAAASPFRRALGGSLTLTIAVIALLGFNLLSMDHSFLSLITTFCLAGTAGYQAVWGVVPALHTPLMSVTNAISGITAVGALLLVGRGTLAAQSLVYLALIASCINIAGGFVVTKRMLAMFKRPGDPREYNVLYYVPGVVLVAVFIAAKVFAKRQIEPMAYLICSLACIISIAALATQKTARFGVNVGVVGVICSVLVTLGLLNVSIWTGGVIFGAVALGTVLGVIIGQAVQVTDLPQTVAAFHSFVGLAAMLTAVAHFTLYPEDSQSSALAAVLGDIIGAITFTGSIVAFLKLHGVMKSKPLNLPGKNWINVLAMLIQVGMVLAFMNLRLFGLEPTYSIRVSILIATAFLSMFLGFHLVGSVGGGDMPVCITVLNSYSGWALVAEGFMLNNSLLTIVGSLIGFSGGILSYIMCKAMNRSLANVLFGGYATAASSSQGAQREAHEHREVSVEDAMEQIANAKKIIIVPGYGMAVAKAQYAVAEIARLCRKRNIIVKFAIHPVAGRMPGQMNVLLAEAGVPYDWVFEMEEINEEFADADVALVVGANDITNSAAEEDPTCAIAGMPVLQVWHAKSCIYMKRSMGSGYADLENPVFFKPNTQMLLGDAKRSLEALVSKMQAYWEV